MLPRFTRNRLIAAIALTAIALTSPVASSAGEPPALGIIAGTRGVGLALTQPLNPHVDVRIDAAHSGLSSRAHLDTTLIDVTAHAMLDRSLTLASARAVIDVRPRLASPWFLSAGVVINNNALDVANEELATRVTINGTTYDAAEAGVISARVTWNRLAPYLGVSLAPAPRKRSRFSFIADAGVMYEGPPHAIVWTSGVLARPEYLKYLQALQAQIGGQLAPTRWLPSIEVGTRVRL